MEIFATIARQLAHDDGWSHMGGWGGGWMWLWGSLLLLSWVAILSAAVWLMTRTRVVRRPSRAREILDERYARGELSSEEYRERLDQIG